MRSGTVRSRTVGGNAPAAVLWAELTKVRTLRSTAAALVLSLLVSVGIAVVDGLSVRHAIDAGSDQVRPDFDPVNAGFVGVQFAQLGVLAFGVLLISGEYGSGMIRASLAAVPRRGLFYGGKIGAAVTVVLPLAVVMAFAGFLTSQGALGPYGVSLTEGAALRAVMGACLYLTLMCLLAVGTATMLRGTALSLGVLFSLVFVLSPVANAVPGLREVARYLPDHAGSQVMTVGSQADPVLGPWTGLLVLVCWTAAALTGGHLLLRRRDA
ncbi:ABC transporter permease [Streptomyces sp. I05A-00742]|uniref:ABC transporter permease n=1 Tax=Streptomyces sp. I05A-00742 TaxID=2732853 RepID=UPI0014898FFD|nr:ABC transporter permease [Streptomyces sp. I05A-00742]